MTTHRTRMLILGSGPAGLSAAIYAARAGLEPIVIEGGQPGGQLTVTTDVENYPGFAAAVQGPWLMRQMRCQAEHVGARMIRDTIVEVDLGVRPFTLRGDGGDSFEGDTLVLAAGATARWLGLDSETALRGNGVSACATCDGVFYKGKRVAVIGGGSTAAEEALYLINHTDRVTLIHRRDGLTADRVLRDRVAAHPAITPLWNKAVRSFVGDKDGLTAIELMDTAGGKDMRIEVDGAFVAIGYDPATALFNRWIDCDADGYVVTEPDSTRTSLKGVFACGDIADRVYRQAVTAAGTGCMAALDAERYLAAISADGRPPAR